MILFDIWRAFIDLSWRKIYLELLHFVTLFWSLNLNCHPSSQFVYVTSQACRLMGYIAWVSLPSNVLSTQPNGLTADSQNRNRNWCTLTQCSPSTFSFVVSQTRHRPTRSRTAPSLRRPTPSCFLGPLSNWGGDRRRSRHSGAGFNWTNFGRFVSCWGKLKLLFMPI